MSLHLVRIRPDPFALATWATRHHLLSPDGDYGYALHALLSAAFGEATPKPFRYLDARQGLLGYSALGLSELRQRAAGAAPEVTRALRLDSLEARVFPSEWRSGQQIAFEVRLRPVVRTRDGRERDAFLHALGLAREEPNPASAQRPSRSAVYADWLTRQVAADGAAEMLRAELCGFRLSRVLRRPPHGTEGRRKALSLSGPDAIFLGELRVGDGQAFNRLVTRGIGRHRAFGFGMLLLRPPC